MNSPGQDGEELGFSYRTRKNDEIVILRQGLVVTTLRGKDAQAFLTAAGTADENRAQHLMARITGNYKRGNEQLASRHPRNRG